MMGKNPAGTGSANPVPALAQAPLFFDGATYNHERDAIRLTRQWWDVWRSVNDGRWYTLREIARRSGHPEASVSARLRDFRKARFGAHTVERSYVGSGLYMYRITPNPEAPVTEAPA